MASPRELVLVVLMADKARAQVAVPVLLEMAAFLAVRLVEAITLMAMVRLAQVLGSARASVPAAVPATAPAMVLVMALAPALARALALAQAQDQALALAQDQALARARA